MSKYNPLWQYLANCGNVKCILPFEKIKDILGFDIDHSFLKYNRELAQYGYEVSKISMKERYVFFVKIDKPNC